MPIFLVLALLPQPLATQLATRDEVVAPMPASFVIGYAAENAQQSIEERIPKGETLQSWTRMVTIQRLAGLSPSGARAFLDRFGKLWTGSCPGAVLSPIADGKQGTTGYSAMRAACPNNPATGKPETVFTRVFVGSRDLVMVQYAMRSAADPAAAASAERYLASVRFCRAGSVCSRD